MRVALRWVGNRMVTSDTSQRLADKRIYTTSVIAHYQCSCRIFGRSISVLQLRYSGSTFEPCDRHGSSSTSDKTSSQRSKFSSDFNELPRLGTVMPIVEPELLDAAPVGGSPWIFGPCRTGGSPDALRSDIRHQPLYRSSGAKKVSPTSVA